MALGPFDDETGNGIDGPGSQQRARQNEHRGNGNRSGVGKHGKQPIGINDPEEQEHAGSKHRNHGSGKALHDEAGE